MIPGFRLDIQLASRLVQYLTELGRQLLATGKTGSDGQHAPTRLMGDVLLSLVIPTPC